MRLLPKRTVTKLVKSSSRSVSGSPTASTTATGRTGASSQTDSNHGIGRGMEFAVMVLLFFGAGFALDTWLETKPIFMIVLVVLAIVGQFASLYYGYEERMKAHEERRAEAARGRGAKLR